MEDKLKAKVEAAIFLTEKPLKATAIAKIVEDDLDRVRQTILELIRDYEERNLGLEISDDGGYIIQVKDEFATLIDEFVPLEIPTSLIRTLSAIAIKQPVFQSEIIKIRGAGAYEHIKELIERELINKKEDGGRSPTLTTTKKFQEYFRLSKDGKSLRQVLIRQGKEAEEAAKAKEEAENGEFDASPDAEGQDLAQSSDPEKVEQLNLNMDRGYQDVNSEKQQEDSTTDLSPQPEPQSQEPQDQETEGDDAPQSSHQDVESEEQITEVVSVQTAEAPALEVVSENIGEI